MININKNTKKIIFQYLKDNISILELGCGDGELINSIADSNHNFKKITAIDYYTEPKNINNKVKFVKQNLENFSLDDKFDLAIMKHVLEHIKNPIGLINNIKKHLNEFGKIIIVVPNRKGYKNEARVYLPEHGKHYFLWDKESLQFTLERIGFTCRFHDIYLPAGNILEKILVNLFKIENSDLICVASPDIQE